MTTHPAGSPDGPDGPVPDYEYDLAHEVTTPSTGHRRRPAHVQVSTQTDDSGGDYGYDLAHDIPRTRPPEKRS